MLTCILQPCYNHLRVPGHFSWFFQTFYINDHAQKWSWTEILFPPFQLVSVQFSHSAGSYSLWPHGLQHARLPCPSLTPGACSNSCPLSQWCHPTISSSVVPFSSCLQSFPASVFSKESALRMRWPKCRSFSFNVSLSTEYSVFIAFRINWFNLVAVQGILKSLLQHRNLKVSN